MGKGTKSIRSECETISRKVEKGTCFREISCKIGVGLCVQFTKATTSRKPNLMLEEKQTKTIWVCDVK